MIKRRGLMFQGYRVVDLLSTYFLHQGYQWSDDFL